MNSLHHLVYSDYCLHLYCYTHDILADASFGLLQVQQDIWCNG